MLIRAITSTRRKRKGRKGGTSIKARTRNGLRFKDRDRSAYWVWVPRVRGLYGPFKSHGEAVYAGEHECKESYKVVLLPTRDQARASQLMKARELKLGHSGGMSHALKRMKHKI